MSKPRPLRYRQVHLDFHTSEHITGIGSAFDADKFVSVLQEAHVNSVTLFAKCHHGWSYYPTQAGAPHPELVQPDLLGDMMRACAAADIETPVYLSVQWDERAAREHPEWRAMSATNRVAHALRDETSALNQLSDAWHTLCLNHADYRAELMEQAREIVTGYTTPGLFFDILQPTGCVCPACIDRMHSTGRDPQNATDRMTNDLEVNENFREEMSAMLRALDPDLRIFYNSGHIAKHGRETYDTYGHLELESLPTGGWGYNHFPSSARYAATLGMDFLAMTGKFHSSWGEFGGFKSAQALDYECAQMVAFGAKCMIGDQLHPDGRINEDTYRSIAPAYARIAALEPYLKDAEQQSEIAVLAAEYYHRDTRPTRSHPGDSGVVQMLLELHRPFDVIDEFADFEGYRLIILPDDIPVVEDLRNSLKNFTDKGGAVLLSGRSGLDPDTGEFSLDAGVEHLGKRAGFDPIYVQQLSRAPLDSRLPNSPFVVYSDAELVRILDAEVLLDLRPAYFNRSYRQFCSHLHTPDDPNAASPGPAVTLSGSIGYVAFPIFETYHAAGQPLYKYIVDSLINRLMPDPLLQCDLPSGGRISLNRQRDHNRSIVHLLYGAPQVRGRAMKAAGESEPQMMEMIEDIPAIGPVSIHLRMAAPPAGVSDILTGEPVEHDFSDGQLHITLPRLYRHAALVIDDPS